MCIYIYIYTYVHTYTHTHIHTYRHVPVLFLAIPRAGGILRRGLDAFVYCQFPEIPIYIYIHIHTYIRIDTH